MVAAFVRQRKSGLASQLLPFKPIAHLGPGESPFPEEAPGFGKIAHVV